MPEVFTQGMTEGVNFPLKLLREMVPGGDVLLLSKKVYRFAGAGAGVTHVLRDPGARLLWLLPESIATAYVVTVKPGYYLGDETFTTVDTGLDVAEGIGGSYTDGDGPYNLSSSGTLPGGLSGSVDYWVRNVGFDVAFYMSEEDALLDRNRVDITSAGTGTHTVHSSIGNGAAAPTTSHLFRNTVGVNIDARFVVPANSSPRPIVLFAPSQFTLGRSAAGSITFWFTE